MLSWTLYALGLTLVLGVAAALWERAAIIGRWPARWGWVLAIALSVAIPVTHAAWPVSGGEEVIEIAANRNSVRTIWDTHAAFTFPVEAALPHAAALATRWQALGWALASMLTAAYFAVGHFALRRAYRNSCPAVVGGCSVAITKSYGPAVIGWMRPTILVPQWIDRLTTRQRELVVAHEEEHVRAKDVRLIRAAILLLIIFPWNLMLWWLFKRLRLAIELDCDLRVLRSCPDAVEYGQVLVHAAALGIRNARGSPALFESSSSLERRVRAMLRDRATYDRSAVVLLVATSIAMGATAANVDTPPTKPWTASTSSSNAQTRVPSPQRQFDEQWVSVIDVIAHFEPSVQHVTNAMTPYVFLVVDDAGRVASHRSEFRPAWERDAISTDELRKIFTEQLVQPPNVVPMFLQVRLSGKSRSAGMVMLAVNPKAKAIDVRAPSVDLSAIRRDRTWMEEVLIRRTESERGLIRMADPGAIEVGLPTGTELWIVLNSAGHYVTGGHRLIVADPNESRRYIQKVLPLAHIGDVVRGTPVRDASGNRIPVSWHWLHSE